MSKSSSGNLKTTQGFKTLYQVAGIKSGKVKETFYNLLVALGALSPIFTLLTQQDNSKTFRV